MQVVRLDDPVWQTTFPRRVTPLDDEWLPGLLLRCDAANHWMSRTTLAQLLHPGKEQGQLRWKTTTPNLVVVPPRSLLLPTLAQGLALAEETLEAATYRRELARLTGLLHPRPSALTRAFRLHLCPACLVQRRVLRRTLVLPHLTLCPEHQVVLQRHCTCGAALELFSPLAAPFTCHACGLEWERLPQIEATPERLKMDQRLYAWYTLFLAHGTPQLVRAAHNIIARRALRQRMRQRAQKTGGNERSVTSSGKRIPEFILHLYQEPASWKPMSLGTLVVALEQHAVALEELTILVPASALVGGKRA